MTSVHPVAGPISRPAAPADVQRHRFQHLDGEAGALLGRIDAMSGPCPVWRVDALATAPERAELRLLAAALLPLVDGTAAG